MSEPAMPKAVADEWMVEENRHIKAIVAFIKRWPNFRTHAIFGLLGSAIGAADMVGIDVEEFLADIRKRSPKPAQLVPPKGS